MTSKLKFTLPLVLVSLVSLMALSCTDEHPSEHPAEHPADSSQKKDSRQATIASVADAVEDYVEADSKVKGGYFMIYDQEKKDSLALTLDKIHKDRLSPIGKDVFFVCADFKATNGHVYDIDFFTQETKGELKLTDTVMVHKVDGKARYGWVKKDEVWQRSKK